MNVEIFILSIGFGILGFALGFAKGSQVTSKHIRESFIDEGYDYDKFYDVINK
tara:strand:+ start:3397 stop:3555 length:159 start_codon:yes stop_codon:yes gene_type:complete